ncbi:hypothetical protein, partial [Acinetobacter baumannii]|uniref:hypothetical protein n=1 Tax=Acinetobacter baumannii TaxID=470 RepID=UPI000FEF49B3
NGDGSFSGTLVPAADFEGDVVVNVPAGIVTDVAGNANLTATESLTVDTLAPGLVITALDPALTATESTTISFTQSMRLMAARLRQMRLRDCWTLLTAH